MSMTQSIPAGYHTVTPYLVVQRAADAIDFYKQAFAATEILRLSAPGGAVAHAEIRIGDSIVMLSDENKEMGFCAPQTVGGSPVCGTDEEAANVGQGIVGLASR
jgi:PhnB protein